jgi:hypothetical protein
MTSKEYSYPRHLTISYSNDLEYRMTVRQIFQMNSDSYPEIVHSDIDPISRDELEYDEKSADIAMQYVMNHTQNEALFAPIYEQAASFMFSTDANIGLAVLFSYDYLLLFHNCLRDYFTSITTNENAFTNQNKNYQLLYNKLFTKR